jgi:negative regulator of flagellin synthesis FlgM
VSSKINGFGGSQPATVGQGKTVKSATRTSGGVSADSTTISQSVHITDAAGQLAALEQAANDLPVVDESRVASVRSAVEQGTYQVAPQSVADGLLKMERSLRALG